MSPSTDTTNDWKILAAAKKASVDATIPGEWRLPAEVIAEYNDETKHQSVMDVATKFLSKQELEITSYDHSYQLLEKIHSGEYSALSVFKAFAHRSAIAGQLTNCCTEYMFELGERIANDLDAYFKEHGKPKGPLHGLPISLKETFNVDGYDSCVGLVVNIGNKNKLVQSATVDMLLEQGVLFYVKTNHPMTMMSADSENNIYGRTLNPLNTAWSAGGSSGGEGSLVAQHGSMIGVGTDIGGSVRFPAHHQNLYGFKPSADRVPYKNKMASGEPNFLGFKPAVGPITRCVEDLDVFMRAILEHKPWTFDSGVYPMGYQPVELPQKLKVGVILAEAGGEDVEVDKDVQDMVSSAATRLKEAGHDVVFCENYPSFQESWDISVGIFNIKVKGLVSAIDKANQAGEPVIKSVTNSKFLYNWGYTTTEKAVELRAGLVKKFSEWEDYFQANNLDVLLLPLAKQKKYEHDTFGTSPYSTTWNLIDFPAAVIPHQDGCVQFVGPKLMDEKLLAVLNVADKAIN
ncbi:hypothetical protein DIURU_003456 [Diutina rugosa]|uniref:amidase n=1 Tax=Diutina rugosa TaxID=5481 RepID=A0A642UN09_DIURU|nr:uncharacterized protein DIURU_003456 [Diutina rugosa]KAA8901086.1 hypothetical protein DIURU_003456 [Diutina rugosa]